MVMWDKRPEPEKSILFTFEEYGALNLLGPVLLNSLNTRHIVNCQ